MDGKPIANKYCEGKMKRTLKRMLKDLKPLRRKRWKLARKVEEECCIVERGDVTLV
jgi:hypothetical protein